MIKTVWRITDASMFIFLYPSKTVVIKALNCFNPTAKCNPKIVCFLEGHFKLVLKSEATLKLSFIPFLFEVNVIICFHEHSNQYRLGNCVWQKCQNKILDVCNSKFHNMTSYQANRTSHHIREMKNSIVCFFVLLFFFSHIKYQKNDINGCGIIILLTMPRTLWYSLWI